LPGSSAKNPTWRLGARLAAPSGSAAGHSSGEPAHWPVSIGRWPLGHPPLVLRAALFLAHVTTVGGRRRDASRAYARAIRSGRSHAPGTTPSPGPASLEPGVGEGLPRGHPPRPAIARACPRKGKRLDRAGGLA